MSTNTCKQWCQPQQLPKGHPHAYNNGTTCQTQDQSPHIP